MLLMSGCASSVAVRIHNNTAVDFIDVTIAGQNYGDIAAGSTSEYQDVESTCRYAVVRLTANGHRVNAQSLYLGAKRFTHQIEIKDLAAGHLRGKIIREPES